MLPTVIYSTLIGIVASVLWGVAFGFKIQNTLLVGLIVGVLLGLVVSFFGKTAKMGGNLREGEIVFVNRSILTAVAVFAILTGLLALIVRFIFF